MYKLDSPRSFPAQISHALSPRSWNESAVEKAEDLNELRQRLLKEDWQVKLYDPLPPHVSEEQAAGLCLELATDHAERVRALLSAQPKVAEAAKDLLLQEKDPKQMRQLAQALLDAGHAIEGNDKHPDSVKQLLDDRKRANREKWEYKQEKYKKAKGKSESESDRLKGLSYARADSLKPYLSLNPKYNAENRNGESNLKGGQDVCRHWALAMQGDRATVKKLLQAAAQGDPVITDAHRKPGSGKKNVNGPGQVAFSRENFGKLLAALVPQLPLQAGEEQSFPVDFAVAANGGEGHVMRLYIGREKKKQNDDPSPFFQIALFEPNVTGDRMHTTVMPEDLHQLQFDSFDARRVCERLGAEILSIQVRNVELAQHMAGQFVKPDVTHQQFAFVNAVFGNNAAGMRAAIKELSGEGLHKLEATPTERKEIFFMKDGEGTSGLYFALQDSYPDVIKALGEALIIFNLDLAELKEILLAKDDRGIPGLFMALNNGHADAIRALGEILRQSKLDPAAQKEVLLAKDKLGNHGLSAALFCNRAGAINAMGDILHVGARDHRLDSCALSEILTPPLEGQNVLGRAMKDGCLGATQAYAEMLIRLQEDPETQLRGEDAKKVLDYLNEAMKQQGAARTPELDSVLLRARTLLTAAAAAAA